MENELQSRLIWIKDTNDYYVQGFVNHEAEPVWLRGRPSPLEEEIMSTAVAAFSDQNARSALVARITARRELMEAMIGCASSKDLEELADDEEEDLKALARLPVESLDHVREKAALLVDRELEERVTFGELALIMSIISDLSHQ